MAERPGEILATPVLERKEPLLDHRLRTPVGERAEPSKSRRSSRAESAAVSIGEGLRQCCGAAPATRAARLLRQAMARASQAIFGEGGLIIATPIESLAQYDNPGPFRRALGDEGARAHNAKAASFVESSRTIAVGLVPAKSTIAALSVRSNMASGTMENSPDTRTGIRAPG